MRFDNENNEKPRRSMMKTFLMILALFVVSACATAQVPVEPFDPCANMPDGWSCEQAEDDGPVEYLLDQGADPNEHPLTLDIPWDQTEMFKKRMTFGRYVDDGAGGVKKEVVDAEIDLLVEPAALEKKSSFGKWWHWTLVGVGAAALGYGTYYVIDQANQPDVVYHGGPPSQ